jgi:hypothetical protein
MSIRRFFLLLLAALAPLTARAAEPRELVESRKLLASRPDVERRTEIMTGLVHLRARLARENDPAWKAVDAEIARNPITDKAPKELLIERISGKWASPRHAYLYRADGTWTMLPAAANATKGNWLVEGNKFISGVTKADTTRETIFLLTKTDFVYGSGRGVFYLQRGEKYVK